MTGNAMRMSCVVVCFCSLTLEPVVGWKSISWVLIMATFVRQMESFGCNMPRNSKKQTPDSRATLPFRASHPCRHARHGMKWCRRRRGVWVVCGLGSVLLSRDRHPAGEGCTKGDGGKRLADAPSSSSLVRNIANASY